MLRDTVTRRVAQNKKQTSRTGFSLSGLLVLEKVKAKK